MANVEPDAGAGPLDRARAAVNAATTADETAVVTELLARRGPPGAAVAPLAADLVARVRATRSRGGSLDAFMAEFELSSREGLALMCLAEALLRIPDAATADRLIRDKLADADWAAHLGHSDSAWVNASTLALMLTGRVVGLAPLGGNAAGDLRAALGRLVVRSGEPVIRQAVTRAMRILGGQFVMGRTIGEALDLAAKDGGIYSFDMLGEGARTAAAAARYHDAYSAAIAAIADAGPSDTDPIAGDGISVKLSALFARYEYAQAARVEAELYPVLHDLAVQARAAGMGFTVDAEEAARLHLSLDLFARLAADPALAGWDGLGLAVQAYQRRAVRVVDWLAELAAATGRRFMVRLVKGAYWDTEIKRAQQAGLASYPVFTRKPATDLSYLACAAALLANPRAFFPQFATHNAHTVAAVVDLAGQAGAPPYEFQRLHGMGEPLYDALAERQAGAPPARIYAPVGGHADLLAYLARRLLENGANTSFVNRIVDEAAPIADLIADPAAAFADLAAVPHAAILAPRDLFGPDRRNSQGVDLDDPGQIRPLLREITTSAEGTWSVAPATASGPSTTIVDPADHRRVVGHATTATIEDAATAMAAAAAAAPAWAATPAHERADCLRRAASAMERGMARFMALAIREAGKTVPDALAEVREAVDFLRYYAERCVADFATPETLPGPTGEHNEIRQVGRGVFVCISPWNFPLAIFTGQIAAALAAGNAVVAKPAPQTPLIAATTVAVLHEAGVPPDALSILPGGADIGAALVADSRVAGVAFTGSTAAAWAINRALAVKQGPIVPLIAETGGQNAMIVDSSALPEQVIDDAVTSAFRSAGQRCSALRVLFLQDDIADPMIEMLAGAMAELRIGDPLDLATDVGPVIDTTACDRLMDHVNAMAAAATTLAVLDLPPAAANGSFFAPRLVEIEDLGVLKGEVFGPFLHVVRYGANQLDAVVDAVNGTGFGLTVGIHSRIDATVRHLTSRIRAGNAYVNRNMIGAAVGSQPFGGEGLSGTGPKAGGPRYLHRFATERVVSTDTTAAGGNAALMTLGDDDGA